MVGRIGAVVLAGRSLRLLRFGLARWPRAEDVDLAVLVPPADAAVAARVLYELELEAQVLPAPDGPVGAALARGLSALECSAALLLAVPAAPAAEAFESLLEAADAGLAQPLSDASRRLHLELPDGWEPEQLAALVRRRAERLRPPLTRLDSPVVAGTVEALEALAAAAGGWESAGWPELSLAAGRVPTVLDDSTWVHVPRPLQRSWQRATESLEALERDVVDLPFEVARSLRWSVDATPAPPRTPDEGGALARLGEPLDRLLGAGPLRRRAPVSRAAARLLRTRSGQRRPAPTTTAEQPPRWRQGRTEAPSRPPRPGVASALFLLPGLGAYGGVLSVLQIADRLCLSGFQAAVAADAPADSWALDELSIAPLRTFGSTAALLEGLPPAGVVVGTRWDTWPLALELAERWRATPLAFVQDDELAQLEDGSEEQAAAAAALSAIEHKVVKSRWLAERVEAAAGGEVHRIPLGLDLDVFRPRAVVAPARPLVVSAARPGVAHRNFDGTVAALRLVTAARPDALPTFFGHRFPPIEGLEHDHRGRLQQEEVAELLSSAAVLVDASTWQGFGRPGLEAMACGTPAVLTPHGGIAEYAEDGVNCLTAEPTDPQAVAAAALTLLEDRALAGRLAEAGLETARRFDAAVEASRWAELLRGILP